MEAVVEPAIKTKKLSKVFGNRRAVDNVSIEVPQGAFLSIFGPNGAGKTTLLRVLSTLSRATSGSATLMGVDLKEDPDKARDHIGLISHNSMLYPDLTAEQNLMIYARLYGVVDPGARPRAAGGGGAETPPPRRSAHVLARHDAAPVHRPRAHP